MSESEVLAPPSDASKSETRVLTVLRAKLRRGHYGLRNEQAEF